MKLDNDELANFTMNAITLQLFTQFSLMKWRATLLGVSVRIELITGESGLQHKPLNSCSIAHSYKSIDDRLELCVCGHQNTSE